MDLLANYTVPILNSIVLNSYHVMLKGQFSIHIGLQASDNSYFKDKNSKWPLHCQKGLLMRLQGGFNNCEQDEPN